MIQNMTFPRPPPTGRHQKLWGLGKLGGGASGNYLQGLQSHREGWPEIDWPGVQLVKTASLEHPPGRGHSSPVSLPTVKEGHHHNCPVTEEEKITS